MKTEIKIIGVTGHRKLNHSGEDIKQILAQKFNVNKVDVVITGMALGFVGSRILYK